MSTLSLMPARVRASTLSDVTTRLRTPLPVIPWLVDATIALGLSALSLITVAGGAPASGSAIR